MIEQKYFEQQNTYFHSFFCKYIYNHIYLCQTLFFEIIYTKSIDDWTNLLTSHFHIVTSLRVSTQVYKNQSETLITRMLINVTIVYRFVRDTPDIYRIRDEFDRIMRSYSWLSLCSITLLSARWFKRDVLQMTTIK